MALFANTAQTMFDSIKYDRRSSEEMSAQELIYRLRTLIEISESMIYDMMGYGFADETTEKTQKPNNLWNISPEELNPLSYQKNQKEIKSQRKKKNVKILHIL